MPVSVPGHRDGQERCRSTGIVVGGARCSSAGHLEGRRGMLMCARGPARSGWSPGMCMPPAVLAQVILLMPS